MYKIRKKDLEPLLDDAAALAKTRTTMPILGFVGLEIADHRIAIESTNLAVHKRLVIGGVEGEDEYRACVASGLFTKIVKASEGAWVVIKPIDGDAECVIKIGQSEYTLPILAWDELASIDSLRRMDTGSEVIEFEIDPRVLIELLKTSLYAAAVDGSRGELVCVRLEYKAENKTLKAVGTDGKRMAITSCGLDLGDSNAFGISIPSDTVGHMIAFVNKVPAEDKVKMSISGRRCCIEYGQNVMTCLLFSSAYINYEKLMPDYLADEYCALTIKKAELESVLSRAKLLYDKSFAKIHFKVDRDQLLIDLIHKTMGQLRDSLGVQRSKPMNDIVFSVNPIYLLEILKTLSADEVILYYKESVSALIVAEVGVDGFTREGLVMPMRIE